MKIGIIGTAGRKTDKNYLNYDIYTKCINAVKAICRNLNMMDIILISGGSAWMDHIAVDLYLQKSVSKLELCLPCPWNDQDRKYKCNGLSTDWKSNPGYYINYLHKKFSEKIGHNTLMDLNEAIKTCSVTIFNGFHARNQEISKCDWIIAFGLGDEIVDGGTKYTYDLCKGGKIYVNVLSL